ncbi:glycosyl transferase [Agromyces rhizosphaerae]|uniref:Glycosyl transferase n=1 Tax=Agromyces rhizosphaerae TaxID=88374 RepID=A0A9W6CSN3_9MICO|nr:glycosyl transferase [Agromyces rhizosphaerae]
MAVVPLFRPDHRVVDNIAALAAQVDRVYAVDDGSGQAADAVVAELADAGIRVARLERNSGIAAALNAGVRSALDDGADFVVNTDQDTLLPDGYVAACIGTFDRANAVTRLGIVCADAVNGAPSIPTWRSPEGLGLVPEAIQSGFVISRECLERSGLFDERLVIDCVDTEFCLRVRSHGFRIAVADGTDIAHELGEMVPYRPFGVNRRNRNGTFEYQYHSPFRQYYITRNNIDLIFRYFRSHRRWTLAVVKRQTGPGIDAVLSGPHRFRHAVAIAAGGLHGFLRVRGPVPARLGRFLRRA